MSLKTWTEDQLRTLHELYPSTNTRELAKMIGKPYPAVKAKAATLGLLKNKDYLMHSSYGPWNTNTDQVLVDKYATTPNKVLCEELGVPDHSLTNRARRLGLKKDREFMREINKEWPEADINVLKENYGKMTRAELAKLLNRTPGAVKSKAAKLGLKVPAAASRLLYKSNQCTYKKGNKPGNSLHDGAITIRYERSNRKSKPYYYIRIGKKDWYPLHQYIWDLLHGKPEKGMVVAFKDGNSLNVLLDNLELITRGENMKRNSASLNMPDSYVASLMTRHDPELKEELLQHPEILEAKRLQLKLNKELNTTE
ncbi:MAG: HNH endonuclease signature motif containing protein [Bacteroidota bacterium]